MPEVDNLYSVEKESVEKSFIYIVCALDKNWLTTWKIKYYILFSVSSPRIREEF